MPKIVVESTPEGDYVRYRCPGCKHDHMVPAKRWNFNEDLESPTLSPSVRHFIPAGENRSEKTICHYFIKNGNIEYCGDCEHDLRGQKIPLPEMEVQN